jgi:hypothetical protein
MNQNKIFVNRNDRNEYVNEFFDSDANKTSGSKTTLKIKVKPSDDDDIDNENELNRKRSSSLNSNTAKASSKQRNILTNLLDETTTYKYLNKVTRPRNLSIDSAKQRKTDKVAFPMRNSTSSNPYYNTTQTAFYPTWDEWKRQNHREKKLKIPDDLEKQAQCANDTTNEQQQNNSIFEETSIHNKYSNSNTTTTGLVANNKQEAKIPNQLEFNNYNERIKMLDHNQKKNNEVYELKIDKQSSYNKQGKNQHSIPIENFSSSSEKTRNEEVFVGKRNTTNKETTALTAATAEPKKSYTFQDKIMQEYFDEMESKRKTLLKNDNVSLIHSMSNDGPYKRNTGKIDLNVNQQQQQKNVKSIKSTLKRKDSFDSKNSSRTRLNELSDSDTEIQNRLLAKASGSIPIEYISIRRDNPTPPPFTEKKTKSISVGTNTAVERGKRIASTNTETEPTPLPAYNLHLSLDSLFTKPKREASTSTDRRKVRDAYTVTDDEGIYRVRSEKCINILPVVERRSRKTRHEAADYRLEFLAKSPSVLRKKEYHHQHHEQHKTLRYHFDDDEIDGGSDNEQHMMRHTYQEVNVDDDDRLIFGDSRCNKVRSGSFPVFRVPLSDLNENGTVTTRRMVKQSKNTSYAPNIFELGALPLMKTYEQQGANTLWNKQFDEMNMKFDSIFDRNSFRNKQINSTVFIESPAKTQRYLKFEK